MAKKRGSNKAPQNSHPIINQESQSDSDVEEEKEKFSLYKLLDLPKASASTPEEIKKQYRLLAMQHHPDKNIGDENARQKFQKVKQAYEVLSNPEKKKLYDETGIIGNEMDSQGFQSAYEYFRAKSRKVQIEDILQFEKNYRNSLEEEEDLIEFYNTHEGNMRSLLQSIPCCINEDLPRFMVFFEQKIKQKSLPKFKAFNQTKQKVSLLPDEKKEVEEMQEEMKKEKEKDEKKGMEELIMAIRNKNQKGSFLDSLQQKYAQKPQKKKVQKSGKEGRKVNKNKK